MRRLSSRGVQNLEVGHEQSSAGHAEQDTGLGARGADRQRAKDLPLLRPREVRFYVWKKAYETHGDEGLINQKPCPYNPRLRTPPDIVEKVLGTHERGAQALREAAWRPLGRCSHRSIHAPVTIQLPTSTTWRNSCPARPRRS